ncbi:hypothetical protein WJX72_008526 [[Myrmecia] bisecta]|uniref:Uncharacterized protein n=1 Tax=[Myrmecia] bisecta TaxID=41462 RepID=A0AAW1R7Y5_9CHLO
MAYRPVALAAVLVLLCLSGAHAAGTSSRKLLQANGFSCTGTVTNAAKCQNIINDPTGCRALAGCAPGQFGNNANHCFPKSCNTFTAQGQAACTAMGCSWTPNPPPKPLLNIGARYAFQADTSNFLFRCNQCTTQNGNGFPDQAFAQAQDTKSNLTHFTVVDAGDGLIGLQADNGLFVARCAGCEDATLNGYPDTVVMSITADKLATSPFAKWKVVDAGSGKVGFQADTGNFMARCHTCYGNSLLADLVDSVFIQVNTLDGNPFATWTPVPL